MARPICLRLLTHCDRRAASRAAWTAGSSRAISTPMIAMTTSSSIRVKPFRRDIRCPPEEKDDRDQGTMTRITTMHDRAARPGPRRAAPHSLRGAGVARLLVAEAPLARLLLAVIGLAGSLGGARSGRRARPGGDVGRLLVVLGAAGHHEQGAEGNDRPQ